jgi:glycosyltransferase involved in cell wall biosynthesis
LEWCNLLRGSWFGCLVINGLAGAAMPDESRADEAGELSVSVVIPAHNGEATLARALDSVLAQSHPPQEIVVVDDFSTDGTAAIAGSYRGTRLLTLDRRRGAAGARNAGVADAKGTWVAFLDADDEWLPSKLEKQVEALRKSPGASFVFCASHEVSAAGESLGDTYGGRAVVAGDGAWKALLSNNFVATPTVMAPRALLLSLGGFDESLKVAEDQDMWIRLALAGPPAYVPESLVRVHVQPRSLSSWTLADQYAFTLPMIERHLNQLGGRLTAREVRAILGERYVRVGLAAADNGELVHGMAMVLHSAFRGYRPLRNLLLTAKLPLAAVYKWFLRREARTLAA